MSPFRSLPCWHVDVSVYFPSAWASWLTMGIMETAVSKAAPDRTGLSSYKGNRPPTQRRPHSNPDSDECYEEKLGTGAEWTGRQREPLSSEGPAAPPDGERTAQRTEDAGRRHRHLGEWDRQKGRRCEGPEVRSCSRAHGRTPDTHISKSGRL